MKQRWYRSLVTIVMVCSILFSLSMLAYAVSYQPDGKIYELPEDADYSTSGHSEAKSFSYGRSSMGELCLSGTISEEAAYNGRIAYSTSGPVTFGYQYDGAFHTDNKDAWNIYSDGGKTVNGIEVPKKVKSGAIIIQKSVDGVNWENAADPINDFFFTSTNGNTNLYTASEEEIMNGMYYRITVAYTMTRLTSTGTFAWIIPTEEYEYKECVEVYEYYIESNKNYITINDMVSRAELGSNASTNNGFYIQKNGSTDTVSVRRVGESSVTAKNFDYFIKPGTYKIEVTTTLGKKHSYTITVSQGLAFTAISPIVYESERDDGFLAENPISGNAVFGSPSLTTLLLARTSGATVSTSTRYDYDAYGVTGQSVSLFIKLKKSGDNIGNGWSLEYDDWGKKEKEKINGIMTGEIGKGALIIQTSSDGRTWSNVDMGRYADGLYTTNFATHYDTNENVLIYTPSGTDVINGVYIRVYFAYQLHNEDEKEYADYIEEYAFYLCSNELNAVTIHNLSAEESGMVEELLGDADENTIQLYKTAETMLSGACTTTGFRVDKSLNPTATYTVKRNGVSVAVPTHNTFTQTGKYEICVTSAVGDKKEIVIYVDRNSDEEAMALYFGNGFLSGKRIFAEGEYPVYEGGEVKYNVAGVPNSFLPVSGTIKNLTTDTEITIEDTRVAKSGTITEAGSYEAVFTTNSGYADDDASGDTRVFIFRFTIIANGTAPGPVVNQESLAEYSHLTITDSAPLYYGLTYQSASKGYITLAFATREDALNYAYNYEKGMVEQQSDGSYRYSGPFYISSQKLRYDSNWDLTEAVNNYAQQAVQECYFNMSDKFTYLTLSPEILERTKNLRTLELNNSIVVFADGQKELLTNTGCLPIINDKPYSYLNPYNGAVDDGENCFMFVTDQYGGIDSSSVVVTDSTGTEHTIQYSRSVGQQLETAGCPSGIITITETTKYGDSVSYQAIYIAPDDNQTEITLTCYSGNEAETTTFTADDAGETVTVHSFSIANISDSLDPCALVIVRDGLRPDFAYSVGDDVNQIWSDPGDYTITCVNRLGYGYTINVRVEESDNAVIVFEGEGTEEIPSILTFHGAKDIELPSLTKYGYDFVGFMDSENNQIYSGEISSVTYRGEKTLTAVWVAKAVTITLQDEHGYVIETMEAEYGGTYDLPAYESTGGGYFVGWEMNGSVLNGNVITVDSEENIVLKAHVDGVTNEPGPAVPTSKPNSYLWIGIILVPSLVIAGTVVFRRKKQVPHKEEGGEKND